MDGEHERDDIIIRNLRADDLARLVHIDEQITGRTRHLWYEGKLKRALQQSDVQISLGVEVDGTLVGAMLAELHYGEFGLPEPVAVLDTVLVERPFAGRGIASAMFAQLVENLRALRIERLRTHVNWDDHELVAFFGRQGFVPLPRLVLETNLTTGT